MADGLDEYGHGKYFRRLDPATEARINREQWDALGEP
jgi:hypothetical protein